MTKLTKIELSGYKSIEQMTLDLGPVNVLIGQNGAGKSNLISFFKLLHEMVSANLQVYIATSGGADALLHYGVKTTQCLEATLVFSTQPEYAVTEYSLRLRHAAPEALVFDEETVVYAFPDGEHRDILGVQGQRDTGLIEAAYEERGQGKGAESALMALTSCHTFQFHDTSATSPMRQSVYIHDNRHLRNDAGNLAAILHKLQETQPLIYRRIVATIRQVSSWFGDFVLKPMELNKENVRLDWKERDSDILFGPHQLPDGTLRAMALITLLLQADEDLPSLIVIDEPELGLHPYAITILAALIKQASHHCQIIVATQSTGLLDQFDVEDVIVVDRDDRESSFKRLEQNKLNEWLETYSLGELWEKNVLGGAPA